jgi:NAD(P)-dependent dehydrogenase (short-subunit alcohol dehydrogenase family)
VTPIDAADFIGEEQQMDATRSLEGLTALVTGATSGIGRAVAEEFGRQGAQVIVHGRDIVRADDVVHAILAEGGRARLLVADLENVCEVQELARQSDPVDVLVNNAGSRKPSALRLGSVTSLCGCPLGRLMSTSV